MDRHAPRRCTPSAGSPLNVAMWPGSDPPDVPPQGKYEMTTAVRTGLTDLVADAQRYLRRILPGWPRQCIHLLHCTPFPTQWHRATTSPD